MVRINLEDFLEDEGFEVESAGNGEAGLELVDRCRFDVAVVDMRLPGIDGNAFIKEAKKMQRICILLFIRVRPSIPCLMSSENWE